MAVDSARAQPRIRFLVILPDCSGCRAMASEDLPVAMPMPMPAPRPVRTAMPAPIATIPLITFLLNFLCVLWVGFRQSSRDSERNRVVKNTNTTACRMPSKMSKYKLKGMGSTKGQTILISSMMM